MPIAEPVLDLDVAREAGLAGEALFEGLEGWRGDRALSGRFASSPDVKQHVEPAAAVVGGPAADGVAVPEQSVGGLVDRCHGTSSGEDQEVEPVAEDGVACGGESVSEIGFSLGDGE